MKYLTTFAYALLAGLAISIGGAAFLASDSRAVGAALFSVGLFAVCTLGLNLFTGKICYALDNPPAYLGNCGLIWLGNLAGAFLAGAAFRATRLTGLAEKAAEVSAGKLADSPGSIFILAVFCNVLIYFLGVAVFVAVGLEHCVANMFYFTMGGAWSPKAVGYLFLMSLGNAAGGLLFPLCKKLKQQSE